MIVYGSLADHINKHLYAVRIPPYYTGLPRGIADFWGPMYEDSWNVHALVDSKKPICHMVNMVISNVRFQIVYDKDVVEILHFVDAYIIDARDSPTASEDVTNFVRKLLILRPWLYKLFRRVKNRHPEWKDAYDGASSGILSLMNKLMGEDAIAKLTRELENAPTIEQSTTSPQECHNQLTGRVNYNI